MLKINSALVVIKQEDALLIGVLLLLSVLSAPLGTTFYSNANVVLASTDALLPSVDIVKPSNNTIFPIGPITLEGTAGRITAGTVVKTVEVKVDDGDYVTATATSKNWSTWSRKLEMQSSGPKIILARVTDSAGNQNWDDIRVIISGNTDLTRPLIKIHQPTENAIIAKNKLVVTGVASDDLSGVTKVEVGVNTGSYRTATPSSPGNWSHWSITLDSTILKLGHNTIFARATDNAGNQNWHDVHIQYPFYDNFSGADYILAPGGISPNGKWYGLWHGGGAFGTKQDQEDNTNNSIFYEEPSAAIAESQTESALVLTTEKFKDFKLSIDVRTDKQLRQNSPPNPWEVAWIIWKWNNNTHFYYFLVTTNGSEVGKYDGGINPADQRILKTNSFPKALVGQWMHWDIFVKDNKITIVVDGRTVFDFNDISSFNDGTIGLYTEDADVSFDNVVVVPSWQLNSKC
jgi:hypothetical protein